MIQVLLRDEFKNREGTEGPLFFTLGGMFMPLEITKIKVNLDNNTSVQVG